MKNKGFTLIELLAVIVILAIIALIATPIILGIIEDAKNNTEDQSINLYRKAVENAVANYVLKNPNDTNITVDKIKEYIKYDGNKVECDITINEDKTVNLNNCKVNDESGSIDSGGTEILYTGEIYRNSTEELYIGDDISNSLSYETDLANISQKNYLKHDVVNNVITSSYACITYTENGIRKDVCVRSGSSYYVSNQTTLRSIASYFNTLDYESGKGSCRFDDQFSGCSSDSLILSEYSTGLACSYGSTYCFAYPDSKSYCIG